MRAASVERFQSVLCPSCGRSVPFLADSRSAFCICGQRVDVTGVTGTSYTPPIVVTMSDEQRLDLLRRLWRQLHTYPFVVRCWSEASARHWFDEWMQKIPNHGCDCLEHFIETTNKHPIRFGSREEFFETGVNAHNAVNERLEKPILSFDEAMLAHNLFANGRYVRSDSRLSVGFIASCFNEIGGTETWHKTIVPRLVNRFNITAVASEDPNRFHPDPVMGTQVSGWDACAATIAQSDVAIAWGVDVSHMLAPGARIIAVDHGDMNSNWYSNQIIANSDLFSHVVTVNEEVADHLRSRISAPVSYIPNAVSVDRIKSTVDIRSQYPWLRDKRVVLWSARISDEKRPNLAVEAALHLPSDWVLVMLGGQPDEQLPPNVHGMGALPSQADWLAVADVFLSTASAEGFGLSMGEAMLAGVPVVATPFGLGTRRGIVTQLSADPTAQEVAAAIVDADRFKVETAKRYIEQNHSVDSIVSQWETLINEVARTANI